jgi:hypothetical protein
MASLERRVSRLEGLRPPPAPPADPAALERTLALLRACAARHGTEVILADLTTYFAAGLKMSTEAAAEMLRGLLSDVVYVGVGPDEAGA